MKWLQRPKRLADCRSRLNALLESAPTDADTFRRAIEREQLNVDRLSEKFSLQLGEQDVEEAERLVGELERLSPGFSSLGVRRDQLVGRLIELEQQVPRWIGEPVAGRCARWRAELSQLCRDLDSLTGLAQKQPLLDARAEQVRLHEDALRALQEAGQLKAALDRAGEAAGLQAVVLGADIEDLAVHLRADTLSDAAIQQLRTAVASMKVPPPPADTGDPMIAEERVRTAQRWAAALDEPERAQRLSTLPGERTLTSAERTAQAEALIGELQERAGRWRRAALESLLDQARVFSQACGGSSELKRRLDELDTALVNNPAQHKRWKDAFDATRQFFESEVDVRAHDLLSYVRDEALRLRTEADALEAAAMQEAQRLQLEALREPLLSLGTRGQLHALSDAVALVGLAEKLTTLQKEVIAAGSEIARRRSAVSARLAALSERAAALDLPPPRVGSERGAGSAHRTLDELASAVRELEATSATYEQELLAQARAAYVRERDLANRCGRLLRRSGRDAPALLSGEPAGLDDLLSGLQSLRDGEPHRRAALAELCSGLADQVRGLVERLADSQPERPEQRRAQQAIVNQLRAALDKPEDDGLARAEALFQAADRADALQRQLTEQRQRIEQDLATAQRLLQEAEDIGVPETYTRTRDHLSALIEGISDPSDDPDRKEAQLRAVLPPLQRLLHHVRRLAIAELDAACRTLVRERAVHLDGPLAEAIEEMLAEVDRAGDELTDRRLRQRARTLADRLQQDSR